MTVERRGLRLAELQAGYPGRRGRPAQRVLDGLNATTAPGELTVLIGPNGTGKSTLLRTVAGLQPALGGQVFIDGITVESIPPTDLARRLAVVLTERDLPPLLTARELAGLGRHPHTGFTGRLSAGDHEIVAWALASVRATHLADRAVTELSDGERQRVLVARALAQEPSAILLDEPTAFLDVTSRVALMGLLRRLARERNLVIVISTHDLELALRVADRVWLLTPTGHLHTGTPEELTLQGVVGTAFDGDELSFDPGSGVFALTPESGGRVRVTADGVHFPLLNRALAREGWHAAENGAAELAVTHTGDGYEAAFDGEITHFATLPELAAWTRIPAVGLAATPPGLLPTAQAKVREALADIGTVGGYFEIEMDEVEDGWRPLADLWNPAILEARITDMSERLGTTEHRVAASILFQGLAARLWSPSLGAAVAHDLLLDLDPGELHWRPAPAGPLPLRATRLPGWDVHDPARLVEPIYHNLMTETLEPLAETVRKVVGIAPGLLWGNAASALFGTVHALARRRPELTAKATALGRELLNRGPLRGTGTLAEPAPGHSFFVRRSCCLYYRVPPGGKCDDCALISNEIRREQWARVVRESGGER